MDFNEMLLNRESCRAFNGQPVDRDLLMQVVEAGRLSPSACNAQPWRFILVDEPEALKGVQDALVVDGGATGAPWRDKVPAFIVVCEEHANTMPIVRQHYNTTQRFVPLDIGLAAMNMCYKAMELGLSTCMIGVCDQDVMEQRRGIPAGHTVWVTLAVGYPAKETAPRKKMRKAIGDVCSLNHY